MQILSFQFFSQDEFLGVNQLYNISLQHNLIKTIEVFQHLPHLKYLNIQHNNVESIPLDMPKTLRFLKLAGEY